MKNYADYEEDYARFYESVKRKDKSVKLLKKNIWILFKWQQDNGFEGSWDSAFRTALDLFLLDAEFDNAEQFKEDISGLFSDSCSRNAYLVVDTDSEEIEEVFTSYNEARRWMENHSLTSQSHRIDIEDASTLADYFEERLRINYSLFYSDKEYKHFKNDLKLSEEQIEERWNRDFETNESVLEVVGWIEKLRA